MGVAIKHASTRVTKSMVNMEVALKFIIFSIVGGHLTCFQSEGAGISRSFVVDLIAFYRVSHKSKTFQMVKLQLKFMNS